MIRHVYEQWRSNRALINLSLQLGLPTMQAIHNFRTAHSGATYPYKDYSDMTDLTNLINTIKGYAMDVDPDLDEDEFLSPFARTVMGTSTTIHLSPQSLVNALYSKFCLRC